MTENGDTEKALVVAVTEVGLSLMDVDMVLSFLKQSNAPTFMITTLNSIMQQLYTAGGALSAVKTGLMTAIEQRDTALHALVESQAEMERLKRAPDTSAEELAQLQYDFDIGNMNNPAVKALVDEVWAQAQQSLIDEMRKRKGA